MRLYGPASAPKVCYEKGLGSVGRQVCLTCHILLWDMWQMMTERQDSPRTLFPFQAKQTSPFLLLSLSSKSPSWGTVQPPCSPRPLLPPPNSHQAAREGHCGTGSLSFSRQSRKDSALPFYQEKCFSATRHFFELGCVPNFSISLWVWRLGDQALNSCLLSLVPFPRLTIFLHYWAIFVAWGLSI